MSFSIKNKYLFLVLLGAFLALFFSGWYMGSSRQRTALEDTVEGLNNEIRQYKATLNSKTVYISQVEQEIETQKELIRNGELEKRELKALNLKQANEISRLSLQIDTLLKDVAHNGTIIVIQKEKIDSLTKQPVSVKKNAILLPFMFDKKDEWLTLHGMFNNEGELDISLKMAVGLDVITGADKRDNHSINVLTRNPYIQPLTIESYKTDKIKPKRFGLGVQVGYGITKDGLSPYVGAGVSYNLMRF